MDAFFISLFGVMNHVSTAQEAARAVLIFAYGLTVLRLGGQRMFGHWSALDVVLTFMIGSALARAMTGSAPLIGTMAAAGILAFLHYALSHASARSRRWSQFFEGGPVVIIDHGRIDHDARKRHMISEADMYEALRQGGVDARTGLDNVKEMRLEPSGKLSVVKVEPCRPDHS